MSTMQNAFSGDFHTGGNQLIGSQITATSVHFGPSTTATDERKKRLLDSLKFKHLDARRSTIRQAYDRTCEWLLNEPEYKNWFTHQKVEEHNGFLWIKGKPGSGKSTLMKFAFSNARKRLRVGYTTASFFFNARGSELEKSTVGMYRSLLWQVLQQQDIEFISKSLEEVTLGIDEYSESPLWSIESLESLFKEVIKELRCPMVCFIDALDECDEDQIRRMVSLFQQLGHIAAQHRIRFQVCFSSRHYPYISIKKAQELVLDGRAGHNQDIANYIDSELNVGAEAAAEAVKAELQEKSCGIFMWVVLVVDLLNKEYDHGQMFALRRRLHQIPKDLSTLFRQILTRDDKSPEQMLLCLQWLLFARNPLEPAQLYHAVLCGIEAEVVFAASLSAKDVEKFILAASKGLAEITESPSTVQFIHESVRDFLLKEDGLRNIWCDLGSDYVGQSHERLKDCCVSYLARFKEEILTHAPQIVKNKPRIAEIHEVYEEKSPLLRYAVSNVLFHAEIAASGYIPQTEFLATFDRATWIMLNNSFRDKKIHMHTAHASLLYIFAELNTANLIKCLPSSHSYLEVEKERCGSPLFVALAAGNSDCVQVFLEFQVEALPSEHPARELVRQYRRESNKRNKSRWTVPFSHNRDIFSHLAEYGDEVVLDIFIKTLDLHPDSLDKSGVTPLARAFRTGQLSVVRLLLENNQVNVNSADVKGCTLLHLATSAGHVKVVKVLLGNERVEKNSKDRLGQTALSKAVISWKQKAFKLLLDDGQAEIDTRDIKGRTPLSHAAEAGPDPLQAVKLLLETGRVEIDSRDKEGRTPLSYAAAAHRQEQIVKLLLRTGEVEIDSRDNEGRTPLSRAAGNDRVQAMKLLLETGQVEIDSRDNKGRTPLSHTAGVYCGGRAVKLLLETGRVEIDSKDSFGRTPLWYAATHFTAAVQSLLEGGEPNVNVRDIAGISPLQAAAASANKDIVLLLLEHDRIDIRQGDWEYDEPRFNRSGLALPRWEGIVRDECSQLIKQKWLARHPLAQETENDDDTPRTSRKRSRQRAFSSSSESRP